MDISSLLLSHSQSIIYPKIRLNIATYCSLTFRLFHFSEALLSVPLVQKVFSVSIYTSDTQLKVTFFQVEYKAPKQVFMYHKYFHEAMLINAKIPTWK